MRFLIFVTVAVLFACSTNEQNCTCESNFEWVKKTFEENDAGFQYIIDKKGQAAYDIHNQLTLKKVKEAKTLTECIGLLYEWLKFFRSGHIGIQLLREQNAQQTTNEIVSETLKMDISEFEKFISTKQETDYEGIWEAVGGDYKIGIKKEGVNYVGFIIESGVDTWKPYMVKLKIEQFDDKLKSTFYSRDHLPVESGEPELIGKKYLQIGQVFLKRLSPVFPDDEPFFENYYKSMYSQNPFMEELNANTLYFRIPSFWHTQQKGIDSILTANRNKILKTENLIIDLRNNGGGSDGTYTNLKEFLYTNPVRMVSLEYLSTPLNNQRFLEFANSSIDSWYKETYEKMQGKLGEFVNPFDKDIIIYERNRVHKYPKNVGILINEGCASATEQFLFETKQSKKVKLFGVSTMGASDISNMYSVESPCKEFKLWYCVSRSLRIPGMTIDDIGLQPDFYLDKSIPQYKWVEFVDEILSK